MSDNSNNPGDWLKEALADHDIDIRKQSSWRAIEAENERLQKNADPAALKKGSKSDVGRSMFDVP